LALAMLGTPAANETNSDAVAVRAVLFHAPDCGECEQVFEFLLPALIEHYGERIQIAAFDASEPNGAALLRAAARTGMLDEPPGFPVVLVGEQSFSGLRAIARNLGDDFDRLAARPEADQWPAIPGLGERLPLGQISLQKRLNSLASDAPSSAQSSSAADRIANGLAVVVLGFMVLALLHSLVRVRRPGNPGGGKGALIIAFLLAGLLVSAYTTYTALAAAQPVCGPIGNCAAVQNSEYAKLFGTPLGVFGMLGYASILITWGLGRHLSPEGGAWRWLPWVFSLLGVLFSIRLTALEPFVIGHTCVWCLGSAISMTVTLWLLSGETRRPATRAVATGQ
jgi:uncharacterized membrane protein